MVGLDTPGPSSSPPAQGAAEISSRESPSDYKEPVYDIKLSTISTGCNDLFNRISTTNDRLLIDIQLPLIQRAADVDLDVTTTHLSLKTEEGGKYKLDVELPYPVEYDQGEAKFDKSQHVLKLSLPVKPSDMSPVSSCTPAAPDSPARS